MRISRLSLLSQRLTDLFITNQIRAWRQFRRSKLRHRLGGHEMAQDANASDQDLEIDGVGESVPVRLRVVEDVGAVDVDCAAAEGLDEREGKYGAVAEAVFEG